MSIAEANRQYFDSITDTYDAKPWWAKVNQKVAEALQARLDWAGIPWANVGSGGDREVRQLDYACGPGLISRIYGPYVTVTRGVDLSPNMVAKYNARARAANLDQSTIHAVVGDLFDKEKPTQLESAEWKDFDLATVGFAFHHFEDVDHAAKCLKERLRPGGVMVISDFLQGGDLKADENGNPIPGTEGDHTGHIHHHHHLHHNDHGQKDKGHHNHHKHGNDKEGDATELTEKTIKEMQSSIVVPHFSIDGVRKIFSEAGFVDVEVVAMDEKVYMEFAGNKVWRTILFAKGRRPFDEKSEL